MKPVVPYETELFKEKDMALTAKEIDDLSRAKKLLENPSFAIKAANYIGRPVEYALEKMDSDLLNNATFKALQTALNVAVGSLGDTAPKFSSNLTHKLMVGGSGAIGGFFGLPALAVELPISTTLMLRSIADIARSQGLNLSDIETRLSCLEVFALGSDRSHDDDAGESAYFAARGALAYEMHAAIQAVQHLSSQAIKEAVARGQMPILIKLINTIASRFGITVSEKLIAQSVPLIGAAGGATINLMFIRHFQDMAEGHFIVKRLERRYGTELVRKQYEKI
jgi:hypothetical protein